uniref:ATP synthase subunit epsilon, mitochondrial n=1 Tax=Angiostrongylus cantonensis TaxID=6313 RepID=A0A0K0DAR2_ANGCA
MVAWRAAGINYVRFSQIAAEVTRQCSKSTAKTTAKKPATLGSLKVRPWVSCKFL